MAVKRLSVGGASLEVKRLYLPYIITAKCPTCGDEIARHFEDDYVSYPKLGEPETVSICCYECDEAFDFDIELDVTLKVTSGLRRQ